MRRIVVLFLFGWVAVAEADDYQVGRYAVLVPTASTAQQYPLRATSHYRFPAEINAVGDAVSTVLIGSGYAMAPVGRRDPRAETMLAAPLPNVQRKLGPIQVAEALKALAGPGFELVVDPIHRLVAFEVSTRFVERASGNGQSVDKVPGFVQWHDTQSTQQ